MRFLLAGNDIIREYTILKCSCQIYHYTQRGLSIFIFCSHTVKLGSVIIKIRFTSSSREIILNQLSQTKNLCCLSSLESKHNNNLDIEFLYRSLANWVFYKYFKSKYY